MLVSERHSLNSHVVFGLQRQEWVMGIKAQSSAIRIDTFTPINACCCPKQPDNSGEIFHAKAKLGKSLKEKH